MSPRPRTVDDAQIAAAFARVINRAGPAGLTLAAIAKEAGLAPATLIQRFGSKRRLLVEMSRGAGDGTAFVAARRRDGLAPLAIVREFFLGYAALAPSPKALIHSFGAYLEIDLGDATLRRNLVATAKTNEALVAGLLAEAVMEGGFRCEDPMAFARCLNAVTTGSLLAWATHRRGTARDWLAQDLDLLLDDRRVAPAPRRRKVVRQGR